jgi:hypothetical protein
VLALLRAGRPAPGRAPPRAIDCFLRLILFKAFFASGIIMHPLQHPTANFPKRREFPESQLLDSRL